MAEDETKKTEVKKITVGFVFGWILGVIFLIAGISFLFSNVLTGILSLLIAILLLPPANSFIAKKFKFSISRGLKIILFFILAAVMGVSLGGKDSDKVADTMDNDSSEEEVITYTPVDLQSFLKEYEDNEVSAESKYTGTYIETTGYIDSVNEDVLGDIYISLVPTDDNMYFGASLQCYVKDGEDVASLAKGQTITLQGKPADTSIPTISVTVKECVVKK